ncbi:MAG: peptidyl-prolyl cis-trans isomerase [Rhodospirillales bacterium]|nr:MAG: peptidyl-prolyl cis-trans isomerase [Rhodospirillales bacterium]
MSVDAARGSAARALVVRALLLREAARRGLTGAAAVESDPDGDDAAIAALLSEAVAVPEPDDATCRRYWANNRARYRSPDLVEAAHILLMAAPDDADARVRAKAAAQELIATLAARPELFPALAAERSACPSKSDGGRLGQVARGDTVDELETFLFNLDAPGLCPVPVPTRYGYHVVRVDHIARGRELPYDAMAGAIAEELRTRSWTRGVAQYIRLLAGAARIEGVDLPAASSPLVQ